MEADVFTDPDVARVVREHAGLGVRGSSCLRDYLFAARAAADISRDELAEGLARSLTSVDEARALPERVVFESHATLAVGPRMHRLASIFQVLYEH